MKNLILLVALVFLCLTRVTAQRLIIPTEKLVHRNRAQSISVLAHFPLGVFQRSHFMGGGLAYAWSRNRFGNNSLHARPIGFTVQAGGDYFFGKEVRTAGYIFRYSAYFYLHAMPGLIYNPSKGVNISLVAGPTLGIYPGETSLGLGASFGSSFYFWERIGIGPSLFFRKHQGADALWSIAIRGTYAF